MKYIIVIYIFAVQTIFGQITKRELDNLPPVTEITQPEPIVVSIGKKTWSLKDFTQLYRRNLQTDTLPEKTPSQFLTQFIDSQLKISKAERDGVDTTTAFKEETATIKKELAASFMVDKTINDALIKEAYERLETEVNVAHILIALGPNPSPVDTLAAYNKIIDIRNRVANGEKFNELAKQYSQDGSAAKDEGNLGYIAAFQTVYPFETACYTTPVGKVSLPFRTIYGYHIVKIIAKREYQRWKAAHIFIAQKATENEASQAIAKKKIDDLYTKLQAGENFENLARQYSEDQTTNTKGGVFKRLFGTDELEKPFEDALFSLKKAGSYSSPIRTAKGWHIVRLLEKQELKSFNEMYNFLQNKVAADMRSDIAKNAYLAKIKKENDFKEYQSVINDCKVLIDSLMSKNISVTKLENALPSKTIFSIGEKEIKARKFLEFSQNKLLKNKKPYQKTEIDTWYKEFESSENLNYEEENLSKKNPEFGMLFNEYKNEILLNNVMDGPIWSQVLQDTTAQKNYYFAHNANYKLPERIKAEVYDASSAENLRKAKEVFSKSPYPVSLRWNDLIFNKNTSELTENHKQHLTNLAILLLKNKDYRVEIAGNIDPDETEGVSSLRAQNVVKQVVKMGVAMDRIVEKDNGKFMPVSKTEREKNQRVNFTISTTNKQDIVKLTNLLKPESLKVYSGYFKKGENKVVDLLRWVPGEQQIEKSGRIIYANIESLEPQRTMQFHEAQGKIIKAMQLEKEQEMLQKLKGMFPVVVNDDLLKKVTK